MSSVLSLNVVSKTKLIKVCKNLVLSYAYCTIKVYRLWIYNKKKKQIFYLSDNLFNIKCFLFSNYVTSFYILLFCMQLYSYLINEEYRFYKKRISHISNFLLENDFLYLMNLEVFIIVWTFKKWHFWNLIKKCWKMFGLKVCIW